MEEREVNKTKINERGIGNILMRMLLKRHYHGWSIVWKLTIATMLLILIPIFAICVIYIHVYQSTSTEAADDKLSGVLFRMEKNIDETLSDADSMLDELFYRQELSYFMNDQNQLSQREIQYYVESVEKERVNNRYFYSNMFGNIGFYSANTQINESQYEWQFYLKDLQKKPYYAEITKVAEKSIYGTVRVTELVSSTLGVEKNVVTTDYNAILPIYRKVYAIGRKKIVGVVEVDVEVDRMVDINHLRNEHPQITKLIVGKRNNIIINTEKENKKIGEKVVKSLGTGKKEVVIEGEKYRVSYAKSPKTGWTNVVFMPVGEVYGDLSKMILSVGMITLLCAAIMGVITYGVINSMMKRLLIIDIMMGRVQGGNFDVVIPEDGKQDEITRIGHSFNVMVSKLNDVLEEKIRYEQAQKEAEIKALQAQINPHFLYNTLENMRMQCEIDGYSVMADSLMTLGELFHYSIKWEENETTLEEEWQNLKNYLYIMGMRYEDELETVLEMSAGVEMIKVPKMILQPLVENCFSHAFKNKMPPWKIEVKVRMEAEILIIEIRDNGCGMNEQQIEWIHRCLSENKTICKQDRKRQSIGILNVKQRIEKICKEGSRLELESQLGKGSCIRIRIRV